MKDYNLDSFKFLTVGKAPEKETIKKVMDKDTPTRKHSTIGKTPKKTKMKKTKSKRSSTKNKKDGN